MNGWRQRTSPVAGLISIVAALVLAGACAGTDEADSMAWEASVIGVEASGCSLVPSVGSGAVLLEPQLVATSAHTVAGSTAIEVIDRDEQRRSADLLWLDPGRDIALLRVVGLEAAPLTIGSADAAARGAVIAWDRRSGFRRSEVVLTRALSVTIEDIYIEEDVSRRAFEFRGSIEPGDSGAVVVVDGAAVGMVYAKARGSDEIGYALDDREIVAALSDFDASIPDLDVPLSEHPVVPSQRCTP